MRESPFAGTGASSDCMGVVRWIARWFLSSCVVIAAVGCSSLFALADPTGKNILVLSSFSVTGAFVQLEPLKATVRSRVNMPVNFYVEYLESQRFGISGYQNAMAETLRRSYGGQRFDLVVVSAYPALQFAVDYRDQIFPGVPIIFMGVAASRLHEGIPWSGVTGVMTNVDVSGSLDLALHLHPDTQNVAVIAGGAELDRYWLGVLRDEIRQHSDKLKMIEMPTVSTKLLLDQVSGLPSHTIVFFHLIPQESSQTEMGTYDVLAAIGQRFPTYCFQPYCLGHGAVGGSFTDQRISGVKAGEMAARVLAGAKPESIPVGQNSVTHPQVDWRQLRRWNIPESALPPGTIVLYRQPTVWEKYEKYVVAGIVLIILQALLIAGLLWQRARKRKIEVTLRESEKRFRVMADTTPSLVWMCDKNGAVTFVNERRIDFTGHDPEAGFDDLWTTYIHPDDVQSVLTANAQALEREERFAKEYRLRRRDGVYRWMLDVAAPRIDGEGKFAGFIGSATDVTDQKMAQEALEKVGGKLIEAQEKERNRIARELHDDICQRLSLISLELQQTHQGSNGTDPRTKARILDIQEQCSKVAGDVQAMSHQLHSSKLDYLGLAAALRSFCREFSKQQTVNIEFKDEDVPDRLPRDVSLCLFRVAQEALSNAVKYSGVRRVSVELRGTADQIQLEVSDTGAGFDVEQAKQRAGLGLVSMQERVHLAGGDFSIESKRNWGTRIVAKVPLRAEVDTLSASA
jgi:PAS domain S-box-containing protein